MAGDMSLQDIARRVKAAQDAVQQIAPISAAQPGFDDAAAYQVLQLVHEARLSEGWRPTGRKIGFTNRLIWPVYNVHEPIWGFVYDRTVSHLEKPAAVLPIRRFAEPRLEPEIVVKFKTAPQPGAGPRDVLACVEWIAHGIEIVQSHFPGWKFTRPDTIADSALHGALLVGPPRPAEALDEGIVTALERFTLTLLRDGVVQDTGSGANVLGNPLAVIAHLIAVLARQKQMPPLQAGEIVTTGTVTQAMPIRPGETWTTKLTGIDLPGLAVSFSA